MKKSMGSTGGFALVVVLGFVVLVVSILVAFLLSTTTERNASGGFAASVAARQLGDTAISLVEAQINHATTYVPTAGDKIAWTSQPGLLRTFKQDGTLLNLYKLYSADNMITNSASSIDPDNASNQDNPTVDWARNPSLWVDLNAPAPAGIDPEATKNNPTASKKEHYVYPILDPRALNDTIDGVVPPLNNAGLSINANSPAVKGAPAVPFQSPSGGVETPAPMPVRWLYVLQNGKVVAPSNGTTAKSVAWLGETADNPVVGRIAFWTDDDTNKVNINTASEGSFWDTPRGYSRTEFSSFAQKQPAKGEYQRYPGHPATVSLSTIFPNLLAEQIYSLIPRVTGDDENVNGPGWTSKGGTVSPTRATNATATSQGVRSDGDRLYSAVDEMIFKGKRAAASPDQRTPVDLLSRNAVESRRFFLTAHSRAPETNLFNLPRIAMWPIYALDPGTKQADALRTTPYDRVIALCSSTGATVDPATGKGQYLYPYFFQRQIALDPTHDLSGASAPGGIPRNAQLYTYLQDLTAGGVPGFGDGNFLNKYNADRDQILTEMFDYVRCTNLYDDLLDYGSSGSVNGTLGLYTFTKSIGSTNATGTTSGSGSGAPGHGLVAPIRHANGTMGQGRYFTLRQLDFIFIDCADTTKDVLNTSNDTTKNLLLKEPFPSGPAIAMDDNSERVQLMVMPEFYSTMVGSRYVRPQMTVEIEGLDGLSLNGKSLKLPAKSSINLNQDPLKLGGGKAAGGPLPPVYALCTLKYNTPPASTADTSLYPFVSIPLTVPKLASMRLTAANDITIRISLPDTAVTPVPVVQSLKISASTLAVNVPVPKLGTSHSKSTVIDPTMWSFYSDGSGIAERGRLRITAGGSYSNSYEAIQPATDTGFSLLPTSTTSGANFRMDYRLVSSTSEIPGSTYGLHPLANATTRLAMLYGNVDDGAAMVTSGGEANPDIPKALPKTDPSPQVADATGDFDRGPGMLSSGAGANKPDEGDIFTKDGAVPYYISTNSTQTSGATFFSPNRIIPSPVMFGSLPTGVKSVVPWRTLLFRPQSATEAKIGTHFGATSPPDHLLLDLFWMPVVDPYPISDRFSTAGKINLNHKIYPFGYIERTTALRAALKSEMMALIPTTDPNVTNNGATTANQDIFGTDPITGGASTDYRAAIDADKMLAQFDDRRFKVAALTSTGKNVFISPSEICEMYMVPKTLPKANNSSPNSGTTVKNNALWSGMPAVLNDYLQTGDNLREKIYATFYQKLTTKSNTYTVHFRAQSLKRIPGSTVGTWTDGKDPILGEYRGSTTIERFIDPAATIPDYAADASTRDDTLDHYYKWRVVQNTQFAP